MNIIQTPVKYLESVVSLCLLGIIVLIGVGVFVKQSDYEMSQFGMDTMVEVLGEKNSNINEKMVLDSLSATGFKKLLETEVYDGQTLYEKINGRAPFYIESGFKKLFTQRFVSRSDEDMWAELYVYDMGTLRNAFSVYSVQRRTEAAITPDIRFGYRTSNSLYFVHGKYYIELVGSSESSELLEATAEIGENIRTHLVADTDSEIAELGLFSEQNLVLGSIKLNLANTFGFEGLTDTFTAQYKFDDETFTAFISKRPGPGDAQLTAERYYNFLIDNGGTAKPAISRIVKELEGKVVDFYGTIEIVGATGRYVFGIHEAENRQSAEKLAAMFINKLSKAANAMNND